MKTIDINAKEWFDKVNGNSYFSADITLDYGTKMEKKYKLPFQYGYGEHYQDMAFDLLKKEGLVDSVHSTLSFWRYCKERKIILRTSKQANCKKRELTA